MATRSPFFTPKLSKALASRLARSLNALKVSRFPSKTIAVLSGQMAEVILRNSVVFNVPSFQTFKRLEDLFQAQIAESVLLSQPASHILNNLWQYLPYRFIYENSSMFIHRGGADIYYYQL